MSPVHAKQPVLTNAVDAWRYLRVHAGLQEEAYDSTLPDELRGALQDPAAPWPSHEPLADQLAAHKTTVEEFTTALLKAAQPYARMLADICSFLEKHGVTESNDAIRLQFDFASYKDRVKFDLEHFREWLTTTERVWADVLVTVWGHDALWQLVSIFEQYRPGPDREVDEARMSPEEVQAARTWDTAGKDDIARLPPELRIFVRTWYRGAWITTLPSLPAVQNQAAQSVVEKIWRLCGRFLSACAAVSTDRAEFEHRRRAKGWRDDGSVSLGWNEFELARLASDHWPASLLASVYRWTEAINRAPSGTRAVVAADCVGKVDRLFAAQPTQLQRSLVNRRLLSDVLALPIWDKRHELYACWVLAQLDRSLDGHPLSLHHHRGKLQLQFRPIHLATWETAGGPLHIYSELRTPTGKPPKGKGRKGGIQPDYRITAPAAPPAWPETKLVLEVKQYAKASRSNFIAAASDYAAACPEAKILLVNYGEIPPAFASSVPAEYQDRTTLLGTFRPEIGCLGEIQPAIWSKFKALVLSILPKPPIAKALRPFADATVLVVDVSGSMGDAIARGGFNSYLDALIAGGSIKRIVAADSSVVASWDVGAFDVSSLANVPRGFTALRRALEGAGIDLAECVVVTDGEGAGQLKGSNAKVMNVDEYDSWPQLEAK